VPKGRDPIVIAAVAINRGLPLATGNSRHDRRIIGLGHDLTLVNGRDGSGAF